MKIKKFKKYIRYFIIVVFGNYILAVIISAVMMSQMTQITYKTTTFGITIEENILNFKANTAQRNYYDYNRELINHEENSIDKLNNFNIKLICSLSLFPLWRKNYDNPSIMDGDQYTIIRSYENGESIIYGSNAYPLTYAFVLSAINSAFR